LMRKNQWIVVTGATSGIGRSTSLELARRGYNVILGVRDVDAGLRVAENSRQRGFEGNMVVHEIDLSDLSSIFHFVAVLASAELCLAGLINNAGVCRLKEVLSPDGIESTLATNAIGPYVLSVLMLERRALPEGSKIINVGTHILPAMLDKRRMMAHAPFAARHAYMQSKLAMIMLAAGLAGITPSATCEVTSIFPGIVRSKLGRESGFSKILGAIFDPFIDAPEKAARHICDLYESSCTKHGLVFNKSELASYRYSGDLPQDVAWLVEYVSGLVAVRSGGNFPVRSRSTQMA
jgi:NAD(P)-dependent dehydrogenase (short-subunit alcohol dehydrogenase family)